MRNFRWAPVCLLALAGLLAGCGGNRLQPPSNREIAVAREKGVQRAVIDTPKGRIMLDLDGVAAPVAVANFVKLVKAKFYDGLHFERSDDKVLLGGDPTRKGSGTAGYSIPDDKNSLRHIRGAVAMASFGPGTGSCQFYICKSDLPGQEGKDVVFGRVAEDMEVADTIVFGEQIKQMTLQ